jgi:putative spermidine/putrescine transport system substrate-binding protein
VEKQIAPMKWQPIALLGFAICLVAGATLWWMGRGAPTLTVVTWPGDYGRAQANAMFHPFTEGHDVDLRIAQYDGDLAPLRTQVKTVHHVWDVIDLELPDAVRACRDGLLDRLDTSTLPPGPHGVPAKDDFVPGALGPCWVASVVYSQIIAYAPARISGPRPKVVEDFFDLRDYPGPRGLRRNSAKGNLELALLADGVKPAEIYPMLETKTGRARAFAKLDTIKPVIVWGSRPADARALLADGKAVMTTMLNGDAFKAQAAGESIGTIWDRQLYEFDVFAIPKNDPRKKRAMDFIAFATRAGPLARMGQWMPYGPARKSAIAMVGTNPETGTPMRAHLPTAPENFATAFRVDDEWWLNHQAQIEPHWRDWLAGTHGSGIN